MRISVEARTDVGLVRELNEDSYRIIPEQKGIVVCDGMGGHAAGEVASATAADTISDLIRTGVDSTAGLYTVPLANNWPQDAMHLALAVRMANRRLYNEATRSHKLRGMGTTVVAALFRQGHVIVAHVGDSRMYRVNANGIEQLTIDHSWVAELLQSGQVQPEDIEHFADKNVITRALGTRPGVQVDLAVHPVAAGDLFLVCSDGLCGYVSDADIESCIKTNSSDLKAAAGALIKAANDAGGLDNSTVALIKIDEPGTSTPLDTESITLPEETEDDLARLDLALRNRYEEGGASAEDRKNEDTGPQPVVTVGPAHRGWKWLLLLGLLAVLALVLAWPRLTGNGNGAPPVLEAPEGERELALLFVAPGTADRTAIAYLDGVDFGTLNDLELGLLVEPGRHTLMIVDSSGDTLFRERFELGPNDTLDLEVR